MNGNMMEWFFLSFVFHTSSLERNDFSPPVLMNRYRKDTKAEETENWKTGAAKKRNKLLKVRIIISMCLHEVCVGISFVLGGGGLLTLAEWL